MGSAKRASNWSAGIALISQVACITTFILGATPRLAAPAIHWLDMSVETAHATLPTVSADRRGAARHSAGPNLDQAFEWSRDAVLTRTEALDAPVSHHVDILDISSDGKPSPSTLSSDRHHYTKIQLNRSVLAPTAAAL